MKNRKAGIQFFLLFSFSMALLTCGCVSTPQTNVRSQAAAEKLTKRVQYLEDVGQIQKLQSKYIHLLFTQRFDRIVDEIYAHDAEDVSIEFSDSGVYRGLDSLTALYKAFERTKQLPGFFILHMTVNPYIEISEDGRQARSHWLSPGASNGPNGSSWIWGPYYVDYVKEAGQWRIHHARLAPVFRNPYDQSWGEAETHGTVNGILGVEPDEPPTLYRPFNEVKEEKDIFRDHPDLPESF